MSVSAPLVVPAHNDRTLMVAAVRRDATGHPSPYDLTNCQIELYIKDNAFAVDPAAIVGTITDAVNGEGEIDFSTGNPGTFWRRVDIVRLDVNPHQRVTIDSGPLIVEAA